MNRLREVHRNAKVRAKGNGNHSNQSVNAQANSLVKDVIEAHGGEKRWRSFNKLTARVVTGGFLWSMKGFEIDSAPRTMTGEFRRQSVRIDPFGNQDWHLHYDPDRVVIENRSGEIIVDQRNPRETFAGHAWGRPGRRRSSLISAATPSGLISTCRFCSASPGWRRQKSLPIRTDWNSKGCALDFRSPFILTAPSKACILTKAAAVSP